ncbi:MAG: WXG100 family type VII secretion target [Bacilli bacterium]
MSLKANTDEIVEAGEKIVALSNEIDGLAEKLFSTINGLFINGSWQGISARRYSEYIRRDPEEFKRFCKTLKSYGEVLVNSGNNLKNMARKYQRYDKNIY